MIKLITDGALPHPARCASCGYGSAGRNFFWFKYREKWGQVLICTLCFDEAAALPETDYVTKKEYEQILETNYRLQKENDRLELATERFTDTFNLAVRDFLADIQKGTITREELGEAISVDLTDSGISVGSETIFNQPVAGNGTAD